MIRLSGVLTAIVTPMHEDESVNEQELRKQVNRQINAGIHGLFCLGTNGEFYALTRDEKSLVMRAVLDEARGRAPVVVGAGCITTAETISLAREAESAGAHAVSVILPYFVAVTQEQLYEHFRRVAEAVSIPVLIYNIPKRTGNAIEVDTVKRLAEVPNIAGIKDSSGDFEHVQRLIHATPNDFAMFVGTDSLILKTLQAGGVGAVSGCANLFPELMAEIYNGWKRGDEDGASRAQELVNPIRGTFKLANPNSIVKRTLNLLGEPVGPARAPVNVDSDHVDAAIWEALAVYPGKTGPHAT